MFKKFAVLTLAAIFLSNFPFIKAQTVTDKKVAQLKFGLTDFRNPSSLRNRYGLLQFSGDGRFLAASGTDRDIKIYDTNTGTLFSTIDSKKIELGKLGFNAFSFSPDGKYALAQEEGYANLRVFETETGKLIRVIDGRGKASSAKQIQSSWYKDLGGLEMVPAPADSDWKNVLVAKHDGLFQVVNLEDGRVIRVLEHSEKPNVAWDFLKMAFQFYSPVPIGFLISSGRFSADGKKIVIANGNEAPTLWEAETGRQIARLEPQTDRVYQAFFSPDSLLVVTSDVDGATKIWNAADGKLISAFGSEKDKNFAAAWNAGSMAIITTSPKGDARFWDALTGKMLFSLENSQAASVLLSPNGKLLATIHQEDKRQLAQIWNAADGQPLATLPREKGEDRAFSIVWSPDGKMLVTASNEAVKIWSVEGKLLQTLDQAVFPTRFNADGKLLATGGKNDTGYVWQIGENRRK